MIDTVELISFAWMQKDRQILLFCTIEEEILLSSPNRFEVRSDKISPVAFHIRASLDQLHLVYFV
jgi:hypothetical protein